jgi:hypothetical protein
VTNTSRTRTLLRNIVSNGLGHAVQAAIIFFLTPYVLRELGDKRYVLPQSELEFSAGGVSTSKNNVRRERGRHTDKPKTRRTEAMNPMAAANLGR